MVIIGFFPKWWIDEEDIPEYEDPIIETGKNIGVTAIAVLLLWALIASGGK